MPTLDRDAVRQKLAAFRARPDEAPPTDMEGRGIVICAGGAQIFLNAYVLLDILRNTLKCELPVEVWHLGPGEMTPAMAALLREHSVAIVDAQEVLRRHPATIVDGWQLKAYALLHSRFSEVLLLDADQVPVSSPEVVFDWPEYRKTGALFWPDVVELMHSADIWDLVGITPQVRQSLESGQLVIDKRRHWNALRLVLYFNEEAETYYRLVYGDKDTFLIAWMLTGSPFQVIRHLPFHEVFGLVQRDPEGKPLFQHRTGGKWTYRGEQVIAPGFVHQEACLASLDRLRRRWAGRVFHPPARSVAARAAEEALAGTTLRISGFGLVAELIDLHPHFELGRGRAPERQHWYVVEEDDGRLALVLHDGARESYYLAADPRGWAGRRLVPPVGEIVASAEAQPWSLPARIGLVEELIRAAGFPNCAEPDFERLEASLTLLARVEPRVTEAIDALVDVAGSPESARRLGEIAARIASFALPIKRARSTALHGNYRIVQRP